MGKRKLCTGIVIGSIVGGLVTLTDPIVRKYTKRKLHTTASQLKFKLKYPTESVRNMRMCTIKFNKDVVNGLHDTINSLEQIEKTLEKVIPQKDPTKNLLK